MKLLPYLIVSLAITQNSCKERTTPKREIYNKDFDWHISIPENFDTISAAQWAKMQNKGLEAVEKTYDAKIENNAKTIFVFKTDERNYFESNYQPFDTAVDGNYLETCKAIDDVLYETFMAQMPDIKIDSAISSEKIDGLEFQTFKMKVSYPNKMVMYVTMYSRIFDKKEFSVNIMYVDKEKGELMLNAWKKSTFGKK